MHQVRRGAYLDSIVLLQLQGFLASQPGVVDAGAVMATAVNLDILEQSGLRPEVETSAEDLLLVAEAESLGVDVGVTPSSVRK